MSNSSQLKHPTLQAWFERGEFRTMGEHQIFCIDSPCRGKSDQVLLVIHGFPTASVDFAESWAALNAHFRIITLDMLGFGFSDKPNRRGYTIHAQADLFDQLLSELGVDKYHLLAHDYGVSVAQELIARQQDENRQAQCLSCAFLNGGLFPETHRALLIQKIMLSSMGKWVNKLAGFKQFSASFSHVFGANTQPSLDELQMFWELINYKQGKHLFHNLITYMNDRKLHRERWLQALQEAPMPLALINGSVDPVSGAHLVDRYKELGCRLDYLKQLPDIGHYPQVEAPQQVTDAYLEFVSGLA